MKNLVLVWIVSAVISAPMAIADKKINSIIAVVNNDSISRLQAEREAANILKIARQNGNTLSFEEASRNALESLIAKRLQLQRARLLGIAIPDHAVERRLAELRAEWEIADGAALAQKVKERFGITMKKFREAVRDEITIQAVYYNEIFIQTPVSDEEVTHFLQTETDATQKRQYHLRHILIAADESNKVQKRTEIEALRARVIAGEDFASLAKTHSDGGNAANGGDLGARESDNIPTPFLTEAKNLRIGELSRIVETARGFHLLQLIDAKRSSLREGVDRIKLSHLFLPLEKKDFAEQLRKEIEVGGDFNALVQKHSIDSISVEKNGDLGWFNVHDLPDYFATTVPTVKEGGISPVIESPFGLHLVRVVEINKQELNAEKTQEWARGIVHERKALENRLEWLEQLRGSAHIIVLDPEYAGIINQENE